MAFARLDLIPSGAFWTVPCLVEATDEEAVDPDALTEERRREIACALRLAANYLMSIDTKGRA
jgi:hypothetical protein